MALRLPASKAAEFAIGSIGCGYDLAIDVRLKYCKESRLLDIQDGEDTREIALPGGITIPNVSKSIKCDKGERMRFRSDVLSFQQMTEQFNQELSLAGKIPSGLFNAMFEFSGCWQKDAAFTKNLAFDGIFISFYTVALDKSQILLREHVKQAVPSTWDPAALARFIDTYGTHIIVGVKMGGKDVIYAKQQHSSKLQPDDLQKRLKEVADKRFVEAASRVQNTASDRIHPTSKVEAKEQRLRFADTNSLGSYANKEDIVFMCKRRGGNDNRNLTHNEWLQTVQTEPDAISMSLIPITSLLNGCPGSGFLSHAINLYLRYKPPISELHQFLEFQLPRQWAPVFSELPLGPQRKQQSCASLQFSFFGPKLFVNTTPVDVGKRPITGMRLYLEGRRSNRLAIHLQHLSSLPKIFQLEDAPNTTMRHDSHDRRYYERVNWKNYSHVCTSPVESEDDLAVVTGAQFLVESHGFKNVLFLRLGFSRVVGTMLAKNYEWDEAVGFAPKSGLISTLISHHFTAPQKQQQPQPRPADVNINSAVYPGGPPVPVQAPKLLKFVDTSEMTRGPQESPGYWVVSGARLLVEKGKISLKVKYSLLTAIMEDEAVEETYEG
ncbi:MACPF domain-containing protein At4g24290 [Raphanus sativus]|uniref:MACPF domain-containing protein At4g24290 n=1 Tax=Raphanus sativus TaxID=3726 RepID=A0A6J0ML88_RAPSA|nr:MACPF domain-containing protein At4g24290 [Raphanus sativus]